MAKIAIIGHGVVGSGLAELLLNDKDRISAQCGEEVELKYILDLRDFSSLPYAHLFTNDINNIIESDVDTVAEAIGGINPSYQFVLSCLKAGKNVVTSNKELVAAKGDELLKAAKENNVRFLFEASVGGGIPIIRPLKTSLLSDHIGEITGILNGTTNYILTKMSAEGVSFDVALKQAQQLGYAERNPDADVKGLDACRKICILADIVSGGICSPDMVKTIGITEITPEQTDAVKSIGGSVKLIARAEFTSDGVSLIVAPFAVMPENPLCHINDVFNGILVDAKATGRVTFIGRGAGKLPTASAMVSDITDCVLNPGSKYNAAWNADTPVALIDQDDYERVWLIKGEKCEFTHNIAGEGMYVTAPVSLNKLKSSLADKQYEFILPVLE